MAKLLLAFNKEISYMAYQVGDRVSVETKNRGFASGRDTMRRKYGMIEKVVAEEPKARYQIRWDRGPISIYTPIKGELRLETDPNAGRED